MKKHNAKTSAYEVYKMYGWDKEKAFKLAKETIDESINSIPQSQLPLEKELMKNGMLYEFKKAYLDLIKKSKEA